MNYIIKQMNLTDLDNKEFNIIQEWWKFNDLKIWKDILPETTYIVWENEIPVVSACLYLMNSPRACMIENLIGNPEFDRTKRKECTKLLFEFLEDKAKELGYKTVVLFSYEDKLKDYYSSLGYEKTLSNVTTFSKKLKE